MELSKSKLLRVSLCICVQIIFLSIQSISIAQENLLDILKDELNREMNELKKQDTPPYFISYTITEIKSFYANASFGTLTGSSKSHERYLTISIRVGNYELDNTHELRGDQYSQDQSYYNQSALQMPIEYGKEAIRSAIWRETNQVYKQVVELFAKVKANVAVKVKEEDRSDDFSKEQKIENYYEPPIDFENLLGNTLNWENKVKMYSQPFLKEQNIFNANASFDFRLIRKYMITSEGTDIVQNLSYASIYVNSFIKSPDGMELPLYKSYFAFEPENLPNDRLIINDVELMIQKLTDLRNANEVEPYTGPAILSGRVAAVFFHEIFGHRIEGQRMKKTDDAQTFKKKINEKVLPEHMSVIFDPGMRDFKGQQLNGFYKYDDEGIAAQNVTIVKAGILKNFLMSRSPLENFHFSNGHGRAMLGNQPVARQSNMLVQSNSTFTIAELRNKLVDECKKQGKEFGLLFDDVLGGFTQTGRYIPNAFNVTPIVVYKVFVDGRPDEIVRGVDLVGTPLTVFSNISAVGNEYGIFNGYCGAESGSVPVSGISPSLLVTQIEVQKKIKSQDRPPILSRPDLDKPQ